LGFQEHHSSRQAQRKGVHLAQHSQQSPFQIIYIS
jgi:hypothetical protein